jgi:succinoglycan biosynthesis transport protein ExoP
VVGVTPRLPRRKARNITRYLASRPFSAFAETGRMILTAMPAQAPAQRGRIILVTSALPGDGKTTLAIMLAAAAARAGLRTVLVDLDIRRPALAERLTDERAPVGLVEFVKGEIPREQLIRVEPRTGFEFITTGRMPREPLELLRDHATLKLMEALRASHDLVVIDSSPLLAVADARLAAQFADQAVLAVRWSHVQIDAVEEALRGLYATGVDVAGCVLTRVDLRRYKLYGKGAASYYAKYKSYYSSSAQRA